MNAARDNRNPSPHRQGSPRLQPYRCCNSQSSRKQAQSGSRQKYKVQNVARTINCDRLQKWASCSGTVHIHPLHHDNIADEQELVAQRMRQHRYAGSPEPTVYGGHPSQVKLILNAYSDMGTVAARSPNPMQYKADQNSESCPWSRRVAQTLGAISPPRRVLDEVT